MKMKMILAYTFTGLLRYKIAVFFTELFETDSIRGSLNESFTVYPDLCPVPHETTNTVYH